MITLRRPITDPEVETYRQDGVVRLRALFDRHWVKRLRELAEEMLTAETRHPQQSQDLAGEGDPGRFFNEMFIWPRVDGFRRIVFEFPAAAIAGALMASSKVNILFDQLLIKEPATAEPTPWHHDMVFWPFEGNQICTLWLALDEVSADSGAVEYIKGSHRWGRRFQPKSFLGDGRYQQDGLERLPDFDALRDEFDTVRFDLAPGDCTVHHGLTVHWAPGNAHRARRRRAYITRWGGDDVVYDPRENTQPMLWTPDIPPGGPIDSDLWPIIWRRAA